MASEPALDLLVAIALMWPVRAPLLEIFFAIPRTSATACGLLAVLMLAGQGINNTASTFPLAGWSMYTTRYPDPEFIDYTVERANGAEERLLIARAFSMAKLRRRLDAAVNTESVLELEALLAAVAQEDKSRHPDNPARTIRIWRSRVIVDGRERAPSIEKHLIREYAPR